MALQGIGSRLRAIRQDRGFTQKQLAGLLGVTEQAVSKWERETSYPDISMLNGISEVMDCSLDYLFQYESGKKTCWIKTASSGGRRLTGICCQTSSLWHLGKISSPYL